MISFKPKLLLRFALVVVPLVILFLSPKNLNAQGIPVKGIVKDETGNVLPGASVTVKGSTVAVATGAKGEFSIPASKGDILVIKFIGYDTQEFTVASSEQANITVALKPQFNSLNEVVVVGYGSQKKENLTGAVAVVNAVGDGCRMLPNSLC